MINLCLSQLPLTRVKVHTVYSYELTCRITVQLWKSSVSVWSICLAFNRCNWLQPQGFGVWSFFRGRGAGRKGVAIVFPTPEVHWKATDMQRTNLSCSWYLSRTSSSMIRFGPSPPTKKCNSGYFWHSSGIIPLSKSIPRNTKHRASRCCLWF